MKTSHVQPWGHGTSIIFLLVNIGVCLSFWDNNWNLLLIFSIYLELETSNYKWLFQLDDSKSLPKTWLFHQTSIKNWLLRVPGRYLPESSIKISARRTPKGFFQPAGGKTCSTPRVFSLPKSSNKNTWIHGNPQPSFLGVITHIYGV